METVSLPPKRSKKVAFSTGLGTEDRGSSAITPVGRSQSTAAQKIRMGLAPDEGVGENKAIAKAAKREKKRKAKAAAATTVAPGPSDGDEPMAEEADASAGATGTAPYSFAEFFAGV